jgi:cysteine desulfuration protein SufE
MFKSCLEKQQKVKNIFLACPSEEAKYEKIIELGKKQKGIGKENKNPENLVKGCQSQMYLHSYWSGNNIIFEAESDALISAGLASLLIEVYSDETPEAIIKCPPTYLEELGITASLTPNRASGLFNLHLRMKQDALKRLVEQEKLEPKENEAKEKKKTK